MYGIDGEIQSFPCHLEEEGEGEKKMKKLHSSIVHNVHSGTV
jgi:hypothetical protein